MGEEEFQLYPLCHLLVRQESSSERNDPYILTAVCFILFVYFL